MGGSLQSFLVDVGAQLNSPLGFAPQSVIVDNPTAFWIYLPDAQRYVGPGYMGAILPLQHAQNAQAQWIDPLTNLPEVGSGQVFLTFSQDSLAPTPGNTNAVAITGGSVTINNVGPIDVNILNSPTVNIAGTVPVNIGNTGTVSISGTVPVNISNTPSVIISGTINANIMAGTVDVQNVSGGILIQAEPESTYRGSAALPMGGGSVTKNIIPAATERAVVIFATTPAGNGQPYLVTIQGHTTSIILTSENWDGIHPFIGYISLALDSSWDINISSGSTGGITFYYFTETGLPLVNAAATSQAYMYLLDPSLNPIYARANFDKSLAVKQTPRVPDKEYGFASGSGGVSSSLISLAANIGPLNICGFTFGCNIRGTSLGAAIGLFQLRISDSLSNSYTICSGVCAETQPIFMTEHDFNDNPINILTGTNWTLYLSLTSRVGTPTWDYFTTVLTSSSPYS